MKKPYWRFVIHDYEHYDKPRGINMTNKTLGQIGYVDLRKHWQGIKKTVKVEHDAWCMLCQGQKRSASQESSGQGMARA